jgi:hypothetical protein
MTAGPERAGEFDQREDDTPQLGWCVSKRVRPAGLVLDALGKGSGPAYNHFNFI